MVLAIVVNSKIVGVALCYSKSSGWYGSIIPSRNVKYISIYCGSLKCKDISRNDTFTRDLHSGNVRQMRDSGQ